MGEERIRIESYNMNEGNIFFLKLGLNFNIVMLKTYHLTQTYNL